MSSNWCCHLNTSALNEEFPGSIIAKMDVFVSCENNFIWNENKHSHLLEPGHTKQAVQHKALKLRSLFSGNHLLGHSKSQNVTFDCFCWIRYARNVISREPNNIIVGLTTNYYSSTIPEQIRATIPKKMQQKGSVLCYRSPFKGYLLGCIQQLFIINLETNQTEALINFIDWLTFLGKIQSFRIMNNYYLSCKLVALSY